MQASTRVWLARLLCLVDELVLCIPSRSALASPLLDSMSMSQGQSGQHFASPHTGHRWWLLMRRQCLTHVHTVSSCPEQSAQLDRVSTDAAAPRSAGFPQAASQAPGTSAMLQPAPGVAAAAQPGVSALAVPAGVPPAALLVGPGAPALDLISGHM